MKHTLAKIRLSRPDKRFLRDEFIRGSLNKEQLVEYFKAYVKRKEWMIWAMADEDKTVYRASLVAKRGNRMYSYLLKKRFKFLYKIRDKPMFQRGDGKKYTRCIFVTHTYDPKEIGIIEAWMRVGKDWNRFRSLILKRFGEFNCIRVWEAQKNGYPHIHATLFFKNREFEVFRWKGKLRIQEKASFEWGHGYTDVIGMKSLYSGVRYSMKYSVKVMERYSEGKAVAKKYTNDHYNLALQWIFNKRIFSVSGSFRLDLKLHLDNSNQITEYQWFLLGVWEGDLGKLAGFGIELTLDDILMIKNSENFKNLERDVFDEYRYDFYSYEQLKLYDGVGSGTKRIF